MLAAFLALFLATPAWGQTSGRELLDHPRRDATLNETTLADLEHWKALLADSNVAIRHLDFEIAKDGHAKRAKISKDDLVQPGEKKFENLRAKNEKLVSDLIARTERALHEARIQPALDALSGATDPLLKDWFHGLVVSTKGDKLDLADALHYYLKRRVTTKIALDIAEGPVHFKFYDKGEEPPSDPKPGDVWLELGQPFPLIAAKAIELGSLALGNGKVTPVRDANAVLRALHFLAVKKVPDGLAFETDDPILTRAAELRSSPDAVVELVSERLGGIGKKDKAKIEDKAFHHYTKHLPEEILATPATEGLAGKIVRSMVGAETPLEKIKRISDARDALAKRYGTDASLTTDELRTIIDDAIRRATDPANEVRDR